MIRRVHHNTEKTDRNFRNDSGVYEWSKLQAARRQEGLDVPRLFFAIFDDPPPISYRLLEALGGVRVPRVELLPELSVSQTVKENHSANNY